MPLPGAGCSEGGVGLEWRRSCISYSITRREVDTPTFESVRDVADFSFGAWAEVACNGHPLPIELAQTEELGTCFEPEYNTRGPNANTVLFVRDWRARELPFEAFGLTLVWHDPDNGAIFDADMQLNETLGRFSNCDGGCPRGGVDLRNVMTHEAGHFLGLGHTPVHDATMSARAELGETDKRSLEGDDIAGVCSIYGDHTPPACGQDDFQPDRGFIAECFSDSSSVRACSCHVPGADTQRQSTAMACAAMLLALLYRRGGGGRV
jgi:hypothetical protein